MEAFFSSLKSEVADRFESCGVAKMELFAYLEIFYNQRRRRSSGYLSPAAFERRANADQDVDAIVLDARNQGILQSAPSGDRSSWVIL